MRREHEPADTRMMGVVHSALRRDLVRTRMVLSAAQPLTDQRRTALSDHLLWMMHLLHQHHASEDSGLFPIVRAADPRAGELLDTMDSDHLAIAGAVTGLEKAATDYRASAEALPSVRRALTELDAVLLPHLRREELEMMPVVSRAISRAQWEEWDQRHNVKPKGFVQLGDEGHWLLDGLDSEHRAVLLALVPPVPRFLLLRGFARRYRAKRARLWGGTPAERVPSLSLSSVSEWG
jgi:hemerythrin-like domain-containing protein